MSGPLLNTTKDYGEKAEKNIRQGKEQYQVWIIFPLTYKVLSPTLRQFREKHWIRNQDNSPLLSDEEDVMNKLLAYVFFAACVSLAFVGCSDKSSDEACLHQVTMDLDHGNYGAVLASSCASAMQRGAAYFGKGGFDIKDVINRFSEANDTSSTQTDLNIYMTALVKQVSDTTLTNLDSAGTEYGNIPTTSESYQDAQFYVSLVDAMKSLSLLKLIIDSDGDGTLNTACDTNGNGNADEIDAASCALYESAGQSCSTLNGSGTVTITQDISTITLAGKSGTYRGLVITVSGVPSTSCPSPNQYKKLLYLQNTNWFTATTTAQSCQEESPDSTRSWPCPVETGGQPLDLVTTIDTTLNDSINSLSSSLTTTTASDMEQSINDIKSQNCCTTETWVPNMPTSCTCSSSELAAYLQTI
jgi:hypothetical protein